MNNKEYRKSVCTFSFNKILLLRTCILLRVGFSFSRLDRKPMRERHTIEGVDELTPSNPKRFMIYLFNQPDVCLVSMVDFMTML